MTRFWVEDTDAGYRMGLDETAYVDEQGGHGPVESLYAAAQRVWDNQAHGTRLRELSDEEKDANTITGQMTDRGFEG